MFGDAEEAQLFLRQVNTSQLEILAHVAQDVSELHRDTQIRCQLERLRVTEAEDAHAHPADGRGNELTVRAELLPGFVARHAQIHLDPVDQRFQFLAWYSVVHDDLPQYAHDRVGRRTVVAVRYAIAMDTQVHRVAVEVD